jgi:4-hydroxybenzoate polyprenyltransferase
MNLSHQIAKKFRTFFSLIRPFTVLAPFIVSLSIMFASFFYQQSNQVLFSVFFTMILPACISLAVLNGASNALNQATDYQTDLISKPYRPIPQGNLSVRQGKMISLGLYIIAFGLAFFVHFNFLVIVLSIAIFTITYSLFPRMKDKLFFNQLWIAIPRGFLGILASWSVFGSVFQPVVLLIAVIAALFLFGGSITKDITDISADKKTGTNTLVNTFGVRRAAVMSFPFLFFPFLLIPAAIDTGLLQEEYWALTFLAIPGFYIFTLLINNRKPSRFFENTSAWALMYATYFIYAVMFSVLSLIASIF